jgi:hypothetical protein
MPSVFPAENAAPSRLLCAKSSVLGRETALLRLADGHHLNQDAATKAVRINPKTEVVPAKMQALR